jgi:hypothetical protein
MTNPWKTCRSWQERSNTGVFDSCPHPAFSIMAERCDNSLIAQGWIGDKPCFMNTDTRMSDTVAVLDVAKG